MPTGLRLPSDFVWPAAWEPISAEERCLDYPRILAEIEENSVPADSLADELAREVSPAHPLYGVHCVAVGRNGDDHNEFLFLTTNPKMPLAFVHLTWTTETGDKFPWVEGYRSWEEFQTKWTTLPTDDFPDSETTG